MTEQSAHIVALKAKHAALDEELAKELSRPTPDESVVSNLKRQKLKVKEEIESAS